ncbi:hypothetical protein Tco_0911019 [Tanacetum coccineum]|uniref:PABC domain-containing protein n=1 Tax=Tanacetum coccineum TaxID=301880 RepID=A0ABQ5D1P5_9ASTR
MSSNTLDYIYPIIFPSDSDVEDAFSSTTTPNYTPASPDYSPALPGNTSLNPSDDLSKYLLASLAISPFYDDPYIKVMQAYNATTNESPIQQPQAPIAPPTVLPLSPVLPLSSIIMSSPDYIYHIIVPSDSDIEDSFSSTHTPNYTPASPDYSPASSRNTYLNPSDDLSKYLLASLAISPFHDDPYMKVMQAYNATSNESPIPPPQAPIAPLTILPLSPVLPLSSMFESRDFFLPKEILPSKKRACARSSSSTSVLPQAFEMGENSHKTSLEQIETILNHLDELPFKRIEHIEDIIEGLVGHDDEIVLARIRTSTLEILIEDIQIRHRSDMKSFLDKIQELKNHKGGPSDY